jgi:general secretion pathway protein N
MSWRVLRWWLLGAVAYLVFLGATLPARYLADRAMRQLPGLELNGVTGSVFSGAAADVRWRGTSLGGMAWRFDWLAPLSASFGYRVHLQGESQELATRMDMGMGHRLYLRGVDGRLPVATVMAWLPLPPRALAGSLTLHLDQLSFKEGSLRSAQGEVDLDEAVLSWPATATLGSFRMLLIPAADGVDAEVSDVASPLRLNAKLSLSSGGAYHLAGTLAAKDPGDSATRSLLAGLGNPDSTGQYPFDFKGQW